MTAARNGQRSRDNDWGGVGSMRATHRKSMA